MSALQETNESLRDRARRVLMDNPDPASAPDSGGYAELVDLRLRAIRLIRDMEPKRACFQDRVRDLTRDLAETPGESMHYKGMLEKLREAHEEWLRLEERLRAAQYVIRSTQWLVDLLADPGYPLSESVAEVAATQSQG